MPSRLFKCIISNIVLGALVVGYSLIGGQLFQTLESDIDDDMRSYVTHTTECHMRKLWQIVRETNGGRHRTVWHNKTLELLKEYQQEVFVAATKGGWDGTEVGVPHQRWTFASSILFSVSLFTTIGYGKIAPVTKAGKLATIIYSVVGIPLYLIFVSNLGILFANAFRWCFSKSAKKTRKSKSYDFDAITEDVDVNDYDNDDDDYGDDDAPSRVPVSASLTLIIGYIALGGWLFSTVENGWDYLTAAYFCFITLTTIGLGDYVAGMEIGYSDTSTLVVTIVYVVFGMAILFMTLDLIQEEVFLTLASLAKCLGFTSSRRNIQILSPPPPSRPPSPRASESTKKKTGLKSDLDYLQSDSEYISDYTTTETSSEESYNGTSAGNGIKQFGQASDY